MQPVVAPDFRLQLALGARPPRRVAARPEGTVVVNGTARLDVT
jgi:hypothetical protein